MLLFLRNCFFWILITVNTFRNAHNIKCELLKNHFVHLISLKKISSYKKKIGISCKTCHIWQRRFKWPPIRFECYHLLSKCYTAIFKWFPIVNYYDSNFYTQKKRNIVYERTKVCVTEIILLNLWWRIAARTCCDEH